MKQRLFRDIPLWLMLAGAGLAGWGLFAPMARFPLIGGVVFSQPDFGGSKALACVILFLFTVAALLLRCEAVLRRLGGLASGMALGLLAGTFFIRHAWVTDKLQQLADATGQTDNGVEALLAKMETGPGFFFLAIGLSLWLAGLVWQLRSRVK